jgi:hypothetical protein
MYLKGSAKMGDPNAVRTADQVIDDLRAQLAAERERAERAEIENKRLTGELHREAKRTYDVQCECGNYIARAERAEGELASCRQDYELLNATFSGFLGDHEKVKGELAACRGERDALRLIAEQACGSRLFPLCPKHDGPCGHHERCSVAAALQPPATAPAERPHEEGRWVGFKWSTTPKCGDEPVE